MIYHTLNNLIEFLHNITIDSQFIFLFGYFLFNLDSPLDHNFR